MQKAAAWCGRHKNGVIFLICVLFLVSTLTGKTGAYETGDDIYINLISAGAFGTCPQYLVHTNVLYGYFLAALNTVLPQLPWYYIALILFNLLAVFALCVVLCRRLSLSWSVALTCAVSFMLSEPFYTSLQYTKQAFLYTVAGGLLLYDCLKRQSFGRKQYAAAQLFLLLGFMIRYKSFLFVLPFLAMSALFALWSCRRKPVSELRRPLLLGIGVPLVLILLSYGIDAAHYADEEWHTFRRFNRLREEIIDYTGVDYEAHREAYDANGIPEESLIMLRALMYADGEMFTTDYLETVKAIEYADGTHDLRFDTRLFLDTLREIIRVLYSNYLGMAFAACVLCILVFGTNRMRLMMLCNAGLLFAEYYYLYCLGRPYFRALTGCWLAAVFVPSVFALEEMTVREEDANRGSEGFSEGKAAHAFRTHPALRYASHAALLLSLLFLAVYSAKQVSNLYTRKGGVPFPDSGSLDHVFTAMRGDAAHHYVGFENYINDDPWQITKARYEGIYENFCFLGDWFVPSPLSLYYFRSHGLLNPVRALVTEENVLFYGNEGYAQVITDYLRAVFPERPLRMENAGDHLWRIVK